MQLAIKVITGRVRRFGFGGPWMKGKPYGQLPLFMIWDEDWLDGEVVFAQIIYKIGIGYPILPV
jgi:hypothetical protein